MVFTATHDDVDELISGQIHYTENNLSCHTRQLLYCFFLQSYYRYGETIGVDVWFADVEVMIIIACNQ